MSAPTRSIRAKLAVVVVFGLPLAASASELREGQLSSDMVPSPVNYGVVLPDEYNDAKEPFPLLLLLHGGKSTHAELSSFWKGILDGLWAKGELSKIVVVMPSTGEPTVDGRTEYMDFKDGSAKWYSFVMGPFLEHIEKEFNVSTDRRKLVVGGVSMGGLGALRFGLTNPDKFVGLAAWEAGIVPALRWRDVRPRNRFIYTDAFLEKIYGKPFDPKYWEANNPAEIAKTNAAQIREIGLQIYIECGDEDFLNLHEGTEHLHRVLWDASIPHEYHLVRGADHLGRTLPRRCAEGLKFLDRALHPPGPDLSPMRREMIEIWKERKARAEKESVP